MSKWDTSQVTNMQGIFSDLDTISVDLSNWDTSKVTTMKSMFKNTKVLDLYHTIETTEIFENGVQTSSDIINSKKQKQDTKWTVTEEIDCEVKYVSMTAGHRNKNHVIKYRTVDGVRLNVLVDDIEFESLPSEFSKCEQNTTKKTTYKLEQVGIDEKYWNWDTSKVTDMSEMFENGNFNHYINNWDVESVTTMRAMFKNNYEFNRPLWKWNPANVMNFNEMFYSPDKHMSFKGDVSFWNTHTSATYVNMFAVNDIQKEYCAIDDSLSQNECTGTWEPRRCFLQDENNKRVVAWTRINSYTFDSVVLDFPPQIGWSESEGVLLIYVQ